MLVLEMCSVLVHRRSVFQLCAFANFLRVTDFDLRQEWGAEMKQLEERGWGNLEGDGFRLTRAGLRFADAAAEMFLR